VRSGVLRVGPNGSTTEDGVALDFQAWLDRQPESGIDAPWFDFVLADTSYRLVINSVSFDRGESNAGPRTFSSLEGLLFADRAPGPRPTP
jgi:hypothetical protein